MLFSNQQKKVSKVNVGDAVKVINAQNYIATVSKIYYEPETTRTVLELDWKENGKSKVYLHDFNKVWFLMKNLN